MSEFINKSTIDGKYQKSVCRGKLNVETSEFRNNQNTKKRREPKRRDNSMHTKIQSEPTVVLRLSPGNLSHPTPLSQPHYGSLGYDRRQYEKKMAATDAGRTKPLPCGTRFQVSVSVRHVYCTHVAGAHFLVALGRLSTCLSPTFIPRPPHLGLLSRRPRERSLPQLPSPFYTRHQPVSCRQNRK